ncbi:MAG: hypothetical protein LBV23_09695 [Deltaproteobacteria bacterium]|nr:hypothetical protein [Deltaproteobacteria bacterium]
MNEEKRYFRKRQNLSALVDKIKLWPSRSGLLHGLKKVSLTVTGIKAVTHCGLIVNVRDCSSSRAARWLRAKQYVALCPRCGVPKWKIDKYGATVFSKRQGRLLSIKEPVGPDGESG